MSTELLEEQLTDTLEDKKYTVVLFNDDVNTFDHVIELLIKVCKHNSIQAEQCAMLVHYKGKCDVKSGTYSEMEKISEVLATNNLTVEIH